MGLVDFHNTCTHMAIKGASLIKIETEYSSLKLDNRFTNISKISAIKLIQQWIYLYQLFIDISVSPVR